MRLHLIIILLSLSLNSFAQYSFTSSIGVGAADAGSNRFNLSSTDYVNYRSLTGGVTFLQHITRKVQIGGTLSYQQYIVKTVVAAVQIFLVAVLE